MESSKSNLYDLFYVISYQSLLPSIIKDVLTDLLFISTLQSFQQIENSSLYIYIGIILGLFGAILMFFEGVSLEEVEVSEDIPKKKIEEK